MGELRQRGRVWWIRYYRNGQRHEESSHSDKKGVAIDLLRIREGDIAKGVPVSARAGRLKVDDALADVLTDYRVNGKRSLSHVEHRIRLHLKPYFGGKRMASITTAEIRAYVDTRREAGAENATVNRELAILKRAFRLSLQAGKLPFVPYVPMLREDNVRSGFFEAEEYEAVRSALPTYLQGVATFAYLTGWRIRSEVLPLEWGRVDRQAQIIRLEPGTTKNADGRTLPYGQLPALVALVDAQWEERERLEAAGIICPSVFHHDGAPIRDFRKAWGAACKPAGYPSKIPHDFRRTAVRNLVRAGVPEKMAMGITGHKTRSVFDRYDIINEADLRAALGRLADETGTEKGQSAGTAKVRRFTRASKTA